MNTIFTKMPMESLIFRHAQCTAGSSKRNKNRESLPAAGREENMKTNTRVYGRGTFV